VNGGTIPLETPSTDSDCTTPVNGLWLDTSA
jgi:hypothetical protein